MNCPRHAFAAILLVALTACYAAAAPDVGPAAAVLDTDPALFLPPEPEPAGAPPALDEVAELATATVQQARGALAQGTLAAWLGALASLLWLCIAALRRWGGRLLDGDTVRLTVIGAGALAAGVGLFADLPWDQALTLFFSGPLASAIHEAAKLLRPPPPGPPAGEAPMPEPARPPRERR